MGKLIISNILSEDEDVALSALKSFGYVMHNNKSVDGISEDDASTMLHSLCQLITSTDNKELCSLAMWCLEGKKLQTRSLEVHIDPILQALVHAIGNPMNFKTIVHKAMEVLVRMLQKVSNMDKSSFWAPIVYRKLLSTDKDDRDAAEKCLKDLESILLPPNHSLSQVVVKDINETLLAKMEKMVKTRSLMLPTVRAWGWLVKLLGGLAGQHRILVNQLLKILEITFVSSDDLVRLASLVSWEALIDGLLQPSVKSEIDTSITPPSFGCQKSFVGPSLKRIKLLMMPIETIIRTERDEVVRLACWRTWVYFAHKIGPGINQLSITTAVVVPIFEEVFKRGPDKGNQPVWDLCLNALEDWVSCKLRDKLNSGMLRVVSDTDMEDRIPSPKTPTCHRPEHINAGNLTIDWVPWSLDSLNLILHLVKTLWDFGIKWLYLKDPSVDNLSLNGALRLLQLVVKGVEEDGKASIKPSKQHVHSVHSLLNFVNSIASDCELIANKKDLISTLWAAVESLTELKSLVLSSIFYKISLTHLVKVEQSRESCKESYSWVEKQDVVQNGSCDVTPIVFVLGVWLRFGCRVMKEAGRDKFMERVERLSVLAIAGLGTTGNLIGIAHVLDWLLSLAYSNSNMIVEKFVDNVEKRCLTDAPKCLDRSKLLMLVWKVFAERIASYLGSANVVPVIEGGVSDSGYQVIQRILLFPIQLHIQDSTLGINGDLQIYDAMTTYDTIESLFTTWFKLFDCVSHIPSRISTKPNFFASLLCQRMSVLLEKQKGEEKAAFHENILLSEMLGTIIRNVLKQTEMSTFEMLAVIRKKRLRSLVSVPGIIHGAPGSETDDISNIRHILYLASRILDISCDEIVAGKTYWLGPASRILEELATFVARLHSQYDLLMFLQYFSDPFAKWLQASYTETHFEQPRRIKVPLLQAWERHLAGLGKHIPLQNFNSNLLSIQASALLAAFQHPQASISSSTLSFWEATYGRTTSLKYPPCLLPILGHLKKRVQVSLPGWPQKEPIKDSGGFSGSVSHRYKGKRWRQMIQQQLLDMKDNPQYNVALTGCKSKMGDIEQPSKLMPAFSIESKTVFSARREGSVGFSKAASTSPQSQIGISLSVDTLLNSLSHMPQTLKDMNKLEKTHEPSRALVDIAANASSNSNGKDEKCFFPLRTDAIISCNTKPGSETTISEADSEACARRKKLKFPDVGSDTFRCSSTSKVPLKVKVEIVGEISNALDHNSDQCVHEKVETERDKHKETVTKKPKRCKDAVHHEVRKLGVKQKRFLRSSGYLRGGKFWRDTLITVKKSQKMMIKPCTSTINSNIEEVIIDKKCRKRGRPRKVQHPGEVPGDKKENVITDLVMEKVNAAKVLRKRGRPRKVRHCGDDAQVDEHQTPLKTMISCGEVKTHVITDEDRAERIQPSVVDSIYNTHSLFQEMQMACNQGESSVELIVKQNSGLDFSPMPFCVQTLNRGILGKTLSSQGGQSEAGIVSTRPHRRKNSFPKRVPLFQIEEPLVEEYNKRMNVGKHNELNLNSLMLSPSKILRSGKRLSSQAYPSLLFNREESPHIVSSAAEDSVQLECKSDPCVSNIKEDKVRNSCMVSLKRLWDEIDGGCISLPFKEERKMCDLLAAMCSSSQWRTMKLEDLACAQKHLWTIMGIISENKEKLLKQSSLLKP